MTRTCSLLALCGIAFCGCGAQIAPRADSGSVDAGIVDADVDADDGTYDPIAIFGSRLVMWLDADDTTTVFSQVVAGRSRVWRWADRSAVRSDAIASYAQWGVNNAVISLNDVAHIDYVVVGDHHALRFHGGIDSNADGATFVVQHPNGMADFVVVVASYSNVPAPTDDGGWGIFYRTAEAHYSLTLAGNGYGSTLPKPSSVVRTTIAYDDSVVSEVSSPTSGWNDGQVHAFSMYLDTVSSVLNLRTNGLEVAGQGRSSSIGGTLQLGGEYRGPPWLESGKYPEGGVPIYAPLDGHIYEVIGVSHAVTQIEFAQLQRYVRRKYDLAL